MIENKNWERYACAAPFFESRMQEYFALGKVRG